MATPSEEQNIDRAIAQLCTQFPQVPPTRIAAVVSEIRAQYDDRPIREFVPLFVERKARRRLHALAASHN
ncbi:hypothetical protein G352_24306 [Rhodococcus ruber BKS 20-38]|uniref:Uncharacterized protein n=1 Tax=Rhodococcus ruber BKS 20-38 TaxID=1278076 RepID=M2XVM2_9NOCA|nr:hypothetical protein [Rhodococcus ruber]EME53265.1 hypothetical protein G352_24306 [Rhodococcus ruber BKS 20-38]